MIIYGALLIPILVAIFLYKYFSHRTVWWEFFIPLAASLIFVVSSKSLIEHVQVTSKEYWGSFVDRVEYFEDWNEYIHRTCTRSCGKNCTTTYDCSYVQYHPAYYQIITTTGETVSISKSEYKKLKSLFGNDNFKDLGRHFHSNDGDKYFSVWERDSIKATPVTTLHYYENRVKAADHSIFNFREVEEKDVKKYSLKDYPEIYGDYKMKVVIGDDSHDAKIADKRFQYINGLLGHKKQVRTFVLIFKNQPVKAATYQKWYWKGANMNEFVICIGIDNDRNVKWCQPISWTKSEILKSEIKNFVQSQSKLSLQAVANFSQTKINNKFKRLDFKTFNYLTVDPPLWAILLTYILTIGLNIALSFWIINNEHHEERRGRRYY